MLTPPDFTDKEIDKIREIICQRYLTDVEIHLADSELKFDGRRDTLSYPTVFWHQRDCNFIVVKSADREYRTRFFYTPHEQFGTGIETYRNLDECVAAVLQTQSDHERNQEDVVSGSTDKTSI